MLSLHFNKQNILRPLQLIIVCLAMVSNLFAQGSIENNNEIDQSSQVYFDLEYSDMIHEAQDHLKELMYSAEIPGLSITVAKDNEILWSQGFGFADLENDVPVRIHTKFRIGSISKSLTSLAVGKLIDKGQLNLEDTVQQFVTYFPRKEYPISIQQLASHTSGIRNYNFGKGEYTSIKNYKTVRESLSIFMDDPLRFQPQSQYSYFTYNYNVLSAVIEEAANLDYISFMKDSVIAPLQLDNTLPDYNERIIKNRSNFYDKSNGQIVNGYPVNNSNKWAGGGYLSTSYDLVRLAQSLLNNTYLQNATKELLWTPVTLSTGQKTNYGIGWRKDVDKENRLYVHHGGSSIGGRSFLLIYPDEYLIVAITSNLSRSFGEDHVLEIAQLFLE